MLAPDGVRIHGLRLRAPRHAPAAQAIVAGALEQADWSGLDGPEALGDAVLILRNLRVAAPLRAVGAETLAAARSLARRAANGWDPDADQADAVRFASRAELFACLARDLLQGRMRWFWRAWRGAFEQRPGRAIVQTLAAEARLWPDVVAHLAARGQARTLWSRLSAADAGQLLTALAQATGWTLGPGVALHAEAASMAVAVPAQASGSLTAVPGWIRDLARNMARNMAQAAEADDAPLRLAIVTWRWTQAPQQLAQADAGAQVAGLARALRQLARDEHIQATPGQGKAATESPPGADFAPSVAPCSSSRVSICPSQPPPPAGAGLDAAIGPPRLSPSPPLGRSGVETRPTAAETRFITSQGGWFYLLNALARLPRLTDPPPASAEQAAGWIWLYQLGTALGGQADPNLARFLAHAAGLADPADLHGQLPGAWLEPGLHLTRARFGQAVCQPGLFPRPARVRASASHVEVHFRLADADLAVRRAGLDVDPGWLPWLGRVVRFHYGETNGHLLRPDQTGSHGF